MIQNIVKDLRDIIIFDGNPRFKLGGGQRVTLDVLQALQDSYKVHLVEIGCTPDFFHRALPITTSHLRLSFPVKSSKTKKSSFNISFFEALSLPIWLLQNFYKTYVYLRQFDPKTSVLYFAAKKSFPFAYFYKTFFGFRVVIHAHTVDDKKSKIYPMFKAFYQIADKVLMPSKFMLEHFSLRNAAYLPNAFSPPSTQTRRKSEKFIVATISSLHEIKGVEHFIKSFDHLTDRKGIEYWVVGDGPLRQELEKLGPQVVFKGHVDEIEAVYRIIDLLVIPTIVEEAFGLVLIEAFAHGIPVVATSLGGQQELLESIQGDLGVQAGDARAIALKVEEFRKYPALYLQKSALVTARVQTFSFVHFKSRLLKIIEGLNE